MMRVVANFRFKCAFQFNLFWGGLSRKKINHVNNCASDLAYQYGAWIAIDTF